MKEEQVVLSTKKKAMMLARLLIVILPLFGRFLAGFFVRFLGSERSAIMTTPNFLILFFVILLCLVLFFRIQLSKKKKNGWILYCLILFFLGLFSSLFRFYVEHQFLVFVGGLTAALVFNVSPGSNEHPDPSRSPSWTENSFEVRVLMERFCETEMEGTSAARSSILGGDEAGEPILRAPSPGGAVEILDLPESPTSVSPPPQQDLNPSMEEGNDRNFPPLATDRPTEHSQGSSSRRRFFIPEIPPFRGRDPEPQVQPSEDSLRSEQILYEEKIIKVAKFFQSFYADNTGERRPTYPRCKRAISKMASSFDELVTLKNALEEGGSESNVFREFKRIVQEDN